MAKAIKHYFQEIIAAILVLIIGGICHLLVWVGEIQAKLINDEKAIDEITKTLKIIDQRIYDLHTLYGPKRRK